MIEKITKIDKIEIVENNTVQVRQRTDIVENGTIISSSYHRWTIPPGQDYSNEDLKVKSICDVVHTQENIDQFKESTKSPELNQEKT